MQVYAYQHYYTEGKCNQKWFFSTRSGEKQVFLNFKLKIEFLWKISIEIHTLGRVSTRYNQHILSLLLISSSLVFPRNPPGLFSLSSYSTVIYTMMFVSSSLEASRAKSSKSFFHRLETVLLSIRLGLGSPIVELKIQLKFHSTLLYESNIMSTIDFSSTCTT